MSVNEVKIKKHGEGPDAFVVKGTGPPSSRTFSIGDEDHTLGNALRHVLIQNSSTVEFAGYSVPHPSERVVQIRVQTKPPSKVEEAPMAIETLKTACQTLNDQCDIFLEKWEALLPEAKEDRLRIEKALLEDGYEDNDDEEEEDDGRI